MTALWGRFCRLGATPQVWGSRTHEWPGYRKGPRPYLYIHERNREADQHLDRTVSPPDQHLRFDFRAVVRTDAFFDHQDDRCDGDPRPRRRRGRRASVGRLTNEPSHHHRSHSSDPAAVARDHVVAASRSDDAGRQRTPVTQEHLPTRAATPRPHTPDNPRRATTAVALPRPGAATSRGPYEHHRQGDHRPSNGRLNDLLDAA